MNPYILAILLVVITGTIGFAEVVNLAPEHRKILQRSSNFKEIHSVGRLPLAIKALCADDNGRLAEPGEKWQVDDVSYDENLPQKRLIWAAQYEKYFVVHYERGGYALTYQVMFATLESGNHAKVLWRGGGERLKDFEGFLKALKKNELDDRLGSHFE